MWLDEFVVVGGADALAKVAARLVQKRKAVGDDADVMLSATLDCLIALACRGHASALCAQPTLATTLRSAFALTANDELVVQPRVLRLLGELCNAAHTAGVALLYSVVVGSNAPPPPPPPAASSSAEGGGAAGVVVPPPLPLRITRNACRPLYAALKARGAASESKTVALELINTLIANQSSLDDTVAMRTAFLKCGLLKSVARLRAECGDAGDDADDEESDVDDESSMTQEDTPEHWAKRLRRALRVFEDHKRRDDYQLLHYGRRETRNAYLDATSNDSPALQRRNTARGGSGDGAAAVVSDDERSDTESSTSEDESTDASKSRAADEQSEVSSASETSDAVSGTQSPRRRRKHTHKRTSTLTRVLTPRPSGSAPPPPPSGAAPTPPGTPQLQVPSGVTTTTTPRERALLRVVIVSPLARDAAVRTVLPVHSDLLVSEVVEHLLAKFPHLVGDDEHALFVPSAALQQSTGSSAVPDSPAGAAAAPSLARLAREGGGVWLENHKTFGDYSLPSPLSAEFRLAPWRFAVQVWDKPATRSYTLLDADWSVAAALRHAELDLGVHADLPADTDYGLFVVRNDAASAENDAASSSGSGAESPRNRRLAFTSSKKSAADLATQSNVQLTKLLSRDQLLLRDQTGRARSAASAAPSADAPAGELDGGVWLDDVKALHHYAALLRHRASVLLTLRVRPRTYLVSMTGQTQNESLLLDPTRSVGDIKQTIAERMLTPAQLSGLNLDDLCLCAASDAPLPNERPLYEARVPATVALRLVPKPVAIELFAPDAGDKSLQLAVQVQATVAALLTRLCGELNLVPADWRAYELLLEKPTTGDSGRDVDSPAGATLRRKRKSKKKKLNALRTLREQGVEAGAILRVVRVGASDAAAAAASGDNNDGAAAGDDDTLAASGSKPADEALYPEPAGPDPNLLLVNGTLRAGSVCALMRMLTSPTEYDRDFMNTFLVTYMSFMTPRQLLRRLVERFDVPATYSAELAQTIRVRVILFVKNWISRASSDVDEVLSELQTFVGTKLATLGGDGLLRALDRAIEEGKAAAAETLAAEAQRQMERLTRLSSEVRFIDCDARVMAYEMTCEAHRRYQSVRTPEFFNEAWNKPALNHLCPNLLSLIDYFNHVSAALTYAIVSERGLRKRADVMAHVVKLAGVLREFNNFHLLMAIVSVFSNCAVGRLKWTRARLPKKTAEQLAEFEALMSVEGSFKAYRTAFASTAPPLIPYMGVYLQDLTFIEQGNPDEINGLVNWEKRVLVSSALEAIQRYQRTPFRRPQEAEQRRRGPPPHVVAHFIATHPRLSEDELYRMSLEVEPRGVDQRSLRM